MIRLLQIELIKLWNRKSGRIFILSYFVIHVLLFLIIPIEIKIDSDKIILVEAGIFELAYVPEIYAFIVLFFRFFFAIVIVSMIANEYSNKTLKQNFIDGLSKKEFVFSKFITISLFSVVFSIIEVFLFAIVLGGKDATYDLSIVFSFLAYVVKWISLFSMCLFFGVLVRKSAFSLGLLILWSFIESVFLTVSGNDFLWRILPLCAILRLIREPFPYAWIASEANYSVQFLDVVIVCTWTLFFVYATYYLIKIRDL